MEVLINLVRREGSSVQFYQWMSRLCIQAVNWMILKSNMKVENVDWFEVGKYLAVVMSAEEITQEGCKY